MLGEEFLSLSLDQVCSLISSDKLTVSSEEKVWRGPSVKLEPLSRWFVGRTCGSMSLFFSNEQQHKRYIFFCPLKKHCFLVHGRCIGFMDPLKKE